MASMVSSEEEPSSKNTAESIQSPRWNISRISEGMISMGNMPLVMEAKPITLSTLGNILEGVLHIGLFVDRHTLRDQQGKAPFPKS